MIVIDRATFVKQMRIQQEMAMRAGAQELARQRREQSTKKEENNASASR